MSVENRRTLSGAKMKDAFHIAPARLRKLRETNQVQATWDQSNNAWQYSIDDLLDLGIKVKNPTLLGLDSVGQTVETPLPQGYAEAKIEARLGRLESQVEQTLMILSRIERRLVKLDEKLSDEKGGEDT